MSNAAGIDGTVIKLHEVSCSLGGRIVVDNLSLTAAAGEVTLLLGRNGAGKSTTLRMIAGASPPQHGHIQVGGHDLRDAPYAARSTLGFAPERPPLYPDMTPLELLHYVCALRGVHRAQDAVTRCIHLWGLEPVAKRAVHKLSQGYRRRTSLATAWVHQPSVLILDEPASGLDPLWRVRLGEHVKAAAQSGVAVIIATHELLEATRLADQIAVMHAGRLIDRFHCREVIDRTLWLEVLQPCDQLAAELRALDGVHLLTTKHHAPWEIQARPEARPAIANAAAPYAMVALHDSNPVEARVLRALQAAS